MPIAKQDVAVAVKQATSRARIVARKAALQMATTLDKALVKAGAAAKRRERKRLRVAILKLAGQAAMVAGTTAAAALAARAAARQVRARRSRGSKA